MPLRNTDPRRRAQGGRSHWAAHLPTPRRSPGYVVVKILKQTPRFPTAHRARPISWGLDGGRVTGSRPQEQGVMCRGRCRSHRPDDVAGPNSARRRRVYGIYAMKTQSARVRDRLVPRACSGAPILDFRPCQSDSFLCSSGGQPGGELGTWAASGSARRPVEPQSSCMSCTARGFAARRRQSSRGQNVTRRRIRGLCERPRNASNARHEAQQTSGAAVPARDSLDTSRRSRSRGADGRSTPKGTAGLRRSSE